VNMMAGTSSADLIDVKSAIFNCRNTFLSVNDVVCGLVTDAEGIGFEMANVETMGLEGVHWMVWRIDRAHDGTVVWWC
jgi:hypothetical protein